jgi:hypothetical protein
VTYWLRGDASLNSATTIFEQRAGGRRVDRVVAQQLAHVVSLRSQPVSMFKTAVVAQVAANRLRAKRAGDLASSTCESVGFKHRSQGDWASQAPVMDRISRRGSGTRTGTRG